MRVVQCVLAVLMAGATSLRATDDVKEITGTVNAYPPDPIDAVTVINYGNYSVQSLMPFDFQNTLYVTNLGVMNAAAGFRFDNVSGTTGNRQPLSRFVNERSGSISVSSVGLQSLAGNVNQSSFLLISATNVINRGLLQSSAFGQTKIEGDNVDLSRSRLNSQLLGGGGGFGDQVISNGFFPDVGIADGYWGGVDLATFAVPPIFQLDTNVGPIVTTPGYRVTNTFQTGIDRFTLVNPIWGVNTNILSETNNITQAAFVGFNTNLISSRIRFSDASSLNEWMVMAVELYMTRSNVVTGAETVDALYMTDDLSASSNWAAFVNYDTGVTYRPGNYRVSRVPLIDNLLGEVGNGSLVTNLLYDETLLNRTVTGLYAGYAPVVVEQGLVVPSTPGAGVSNIAGRLEIQAKNLNLELARARANGLMSIKADHLQSAAGAVLESGNYMFDLGSTNGLLQVSSLTSTNPIRIFEGPIYMWSALWTNQSEIVVEITDDEGNVTYETNTVDHGYHVWAVDAREFGSTVPSSTYNLVLRSRDVIVDDSYQLVGTLLFDAENVTLNGTINLLGQSFTPTNAPRLRSFDLQGGLANMGDAVFGVGTSTRLERLVNGGSMSAGSLTVAADYFENGGNISPGRLIRIDAGVGKFENGQINASGLVDIAGRDLKFHRHTLSTTGRLLLSPTNTLADSGGDAAVQMTCGDGFVMSRKPTRGDLLGTRLQTSAGRLITVDNVWAGADRGTTVDGFKDNAAVGRLVLASGLDSELHFSGPDDLGTYAVYVDYLDLQGYAQWAYGRGVLEDYLKVDPGMTIYYAYANVPPEDLDGALGGRLRWVSSFAGPNSSVTVRLPSGKTAQFNRGLRESYRIDSDGDGIANGYDTEPFPEPQAVASLSEGAASRATVRWVAAPEASYTVEYTSDVVSGPWQVLARVRNPEKAVRELSVEDPTAVSAARYYRVIYNP